ncbi:52 kDa repressor of the inhibitor of the protein kinase-like isoform X2 [Mytilus edulis]|uniref:52 kDa repressor of the inhibitor of the protein kinase-like isoform X2 n=1 Tax=Mytilus edulis TaxID=6550 RepID=UPI0039F04BC5
MKRQSSILDVFSSLNLVLSQCTKIQLVRNMVDISEKVILFYNNSPKRNNHLQQCLLQESNITKTKLLDTCQTRFIERHDAFDVFCGLYDTIILSLNDMSQRKDFNRETSSEATTLLAAITSFSFVITLITVKNLMGYTVGLSRKLQGRSQDIISAYMSVQSVLPLLVEVRENVDCKFLAWYEEAVVMGKEHDIVPSVPRTCGRQRNRCNVPGETPDVYFRRALCIPYIDELISGINDRFSSLSKTAVMALVLIPEMTIQKQHAHVILENIKPFLDFYHSDLPSPFGISSEVDRWLHFWKHTTDTLPKSAAETIKKCNKLDYPNIYAILKIVCTMSVTSCECERSNSELGLLKTFLRATMGQDRLNGLALMHVHYNLELELDVIVDMFARRHPRKMKMESIL